MPAPALTTEADRPAREPDPEHVDVLIVGAGLSGIGAACHLQRRCPEKTYAILEARESIGGTWDLFRYPGIRSDSDMYTLGYVFKPWRDAKSIADGPSILSYIEETAVEHGVQGKIRFGHRAIRAEWSSETCLWTVTAERGEAGGMDKGGRIGETEQMGETGHMGERGDAGRMDEAGEVGQAEGMAEAGERGDGGTGETATFTCSFLHMCSGYYRYDQGYSPEFPGAERFGGEIVHPQHWPESLDYSGKRVVVIGSGATAVTLVPAMADRAAHVTMLQRSPSYIVSLPSEDPIAAWLRRRLPARAVYAIVRWKNVLLTMASFQLSRRRPALMRKLVRKRQESLLPAGFDLDTHFNPAYDPWDQRLCLVPNGDLFEVLGDGRASIVTDHIDAFTPTGIRLKSGRELEADVIVTATGLDLLALGGIELSVDGRAVELGETMSYKGMMLSDVPNMAFSVGYTNASWTLKCDLTCEYVCRLLRHMDTGGYRVCAPRRDPGVRPLPFIDFSSGYVQRAIDRFPKQGSTAPWRLHQNYARDILALRRGSVEDGVMQFSRAAAPVGEREPALV